MWRFKELYNYHNHQHTGVLIRESEFREVTKDIPKKVKEKIDLWFFTLGKPIKDIIKEFRNFENPEAEKVKEDVQIKAKPQDDEFPVEIDFANDSSEPQATGSKTENPNLSNKVNKADVGVRISSINSYMSNTFIYPTQEDFGAFCKSLEAQAKGLMSGMFYAFSEDRKS